MRSLLQVLSSLAACIYQCSKSGNASRMHHWFQTVPCAISSAVSHLERWTSLCSGQPPHITSTTLMASSGLFFHTSDALRQIFSILLMSAQGRHKNSLVQKAGGGNRARQAPKSNISFWLQRIFLLFPWQSVTVPILALWVPSPLRSISNKCGHERTHSWQDRERTVKTAYSLLHLGICL